MQTVPRFMSLVSCASKVFFATGKACARYEVGINTVHATANFKPHRIHSTSAEMTKEPLPVARRRLTSMATCNVSSTTKGSMRCSVRVCGCHSEKTLFVQNDIRVLTSFTHSLKHKHKRTDSRLTCKSGLRLTSRSETAPF